MWSALTVIDLLIIADQPWMVACLVDGRSNTVIIKIWYLYLWYRCGNGSLWIVGIDINPHSITNWACLTVGPNKRIASSQWLGGKTISQKYSCSYIPVYDDNLEKSAHYSYFSIYQENVILFVYWRRILSTSALEKLCGLVFLSAQTGSVCKCKAQMFIIAEQKSENFRNFAHAKIVFATLLHKLHWRKNLSCIGWNSCAHIVWWINSLRYMASYILIH